LPENTTFFYSIDNKQKRGYKLSQTTFEGIGLSSSIAEKGFALVEHDITTDEIDALISAYATFTDELPDPDLFTVHSMIKDSEHLDDLSYASDHKRQWHKYRTNHPQYAKPGGYTNRSLQIKALRFYGRDHDAIGKPVEDDPKEYYHYHPNSLVKMKAMHDEFGWGPIPPEVIALHTRFATIWRLANTAMSSTFQLLEEEHPELMSRFTRPEDLATSPLRLIFYHPGQGDILAGGHYDKSTFTMQIAESHLGLRARNPVTQEMGLVQRPAKEAAVFPGLLWDRMYPDSSLEPTWHDVINMDEVNPGLNIRGRKCARWALIWFSNSTALNIPQKADTHTIAETII